MKNLDINLFQPTSLPEMESAAVNVLRTGNIANGKSVNELEESFSKLIGQKNFVAVNNLTSSLIISLHLALNWHCFVCFVWLPLVSPLCSTYIGSYLSA